MKGEHVDSINIFKCNCGPFRRMLKKSIILIHFKIHKFVLYAADADYERAGEPRESSPLCNIHAKLFLR